MKPFAIFDRGLIDTIAFSRVMGTDIPNEWLINAKGRYDLAAVFNKEDLKFDPTIYATDFDMTEYRRKADIAIRQLLEELSIPTVEIQGTVAERIAQFSCVLEILSELEKKEGKISLENEASLYKCKER